MWFLLIEDGRRVGYMKRVGAATLYARDGHVFSGRPIAHGRALPETALRTLGGERVYDGDVVELRPRPGAPFVERLVFTDGAGAVRFGIPGSTRVETPEGSGPHAVAVSRKLGSAHTDRFYERRYRAALDDDGDDDGAWGPALRTAAASLGGGLASAFIQLRLSDGVGPLATLAGAGLGLTVALRREARAGRRLRHAFLLRTATRAGLVNGGLVGALHVFSRVSGDRTPAELAVGAFGAAVLGFLATFGLVTIVGNALDHYTPPKPHPSLPPAEDDDSSHSDRAHPDG